MIRIAFDPFKMVLEVANDLYPGTKADVFFSMDPVGKEYGVTDFGGPVPAILICAQTPFFATPEILAHEIAHVVCGLDAAHGKQWDKVFSAIQREYQKRIKAEAKKTGLKAKNPYKKPAKKVVERAKRPK